ncbi:hypothetical protein HY522_12730 [bacterium]|nr:hypothetical protein [bacterium]
MGVPHPNCSEEGSTLLVILAVALIAAVLWMIRFGGSVKKDVSDVPEFATQKLPAKDIKRAREAERELDDRAREVNRQMDDIHE